jgi:hypothetical protein
MSAAGRRLQGRGDRSAVWGRAPGPKRTARAANRPASPLRSRGAQGGRAPFPFGGAGARGRAMLLDLLHQPLRLGGLLEGVDLRIRPADPQVRLDGRQHFQDLRCLLLGQHVDLQLQVGAALGQALSAQRAPGFWVIRMKEERMIASLLTTTPSRLNGSGSKWRAGAVGKTFQPIQTVIHAPRGHPGAARGTAGCR